MNKFISWLAIGIAIIAMVVAVVGGNNQPQSSSEAPVGYTGTRFPHGIAIGDPVALGVAPTNISKILMGSCNPTFSGTSFAATSSAQFFCAVTGVTAGDQVDIWLPVGAGANAQGAGSIAGGFTINGTYASTTNVIGFNMLNMTGAATTSFAQATTGVMYMVRDTQ